MIVVDRITPSLNKIQRELSNLVSEAYQVFKDNTPVRSGNARKKTRLKGDTILAAYPYARKLDGGWSRQNPDGMVKPTAKFIEQRLRKILRK
jgi:hypothetical protein